MVDSETPEVKNKSLEFKESIEKLLTFFFVVFLLLGLFTTYRYLDDWREENVPSQEPEDVLTSGMLACIELGCPFGTKYIGSSQGTNYYECTTAMARSLVEENRVCFNSIDDAVALGYKG